MTDAFAILGLPRRAALDEEALQKAYAAQSRASHPDHGGDEQRAAEVNRSYETLRAPEKRLKHLLELAAPEEAKQWRAVPMDETMMTLFSKLGNALESSAQFLEKRGRAQTAIAKALLANEGMQQREALEQIGFEVESRRSEMEHMLPAIDEALSKAEELVWRQLAALQAKLAYFSKWQIQVRERLLALI